MSNLMTVEGLVRFIESDDYKSDDARSLVNKLKKDSKNDLYEKLRSKFSMEKHHEIRNRLAIALLDLGDRRALKDLIKAVNSDETKGYRGTLLYAMKDFNPIEYIYDLIYIVINDTLEASGEALDIIEELDGQIDEEQLEKCMKLIKEELKSAKGKQKEDLDYLLEMFEG